MLDLVDCFLFGIPFKSRLQFHTAIVLAARSLGKSILN
jgi:hypothetical protein